MIPPDNYASVCIVVPDIVSDCSFEPLSEVGGNLIIRTLNSKHVRGGGKPYWSRHSCKVTVSPEYFDVIKNGSLNIYCFEVYKVISGHCRKNFLHKCEAACDFLCYEECRFDLLRTDRRQSAERDASDNDALCSCGPQLNKYFIVETYDYVKYPSV